MLSIPAARYSSRIERISARVWPWQVRWAIGVIEVSRRTQVTTSRVR